MQIPATPKSPAIPIGPNHPLTIIAGPCVAESHDLCLTIGTAMRDKCQQLGFNYIFKASYDKANRSSISSARGPGLEEGLKLIRAVGDELGTPVTTDIHESAQAPMVGEYIDLIQIPAFLCRQTDLLVAAAKTGRPVNVKKGQFLSPQEMTNVIKKLHEADCTNLMLTERGTFFGYNRLVNDFVGLGDLIELGHTAGLASASKQPHPVCFDVTHSTQQPGGQGNASGGRPERAPLLARAALVSGVHALFIETHPDPKSALSDAATMLPLEQTLKLLDELKTLADVLSPPAL